MSTMKLAPFIAVTALLLCAGSMRLSAQDFHESWALDKAASTMDSRMNEWLAGMGMVTTVTGENLKITITYKTYNEDFTDVIELTIGGEAKTRDIMGGRGKATSNAVWGEYEKSVKIHSESTFEGENGTFSFTTDDHYQLSDDEQNLILNRTMTSPQGERKSTLIFKKKI